MIIRFLYPWLNNKNKKTRLLSGLILVLICSFFLTSCGPESEKTAVNTEVQETATDTEIQETRYYSISFEGGTGKAYIQSPVEVQISGNDITACFIWSSKNYDYMIVDGNRYDNENPGGESTFHVKVKSLDEPLKVIGDTTAMSEPHEIEYVITWLQETGENEIATNSDASNDKGTVTDSSKNSERSAADSSGDFEKVEFKDQPEGSEEKLSYAECFRILDYDGFKLVQIKNSGNYVVVDEGAQEPEITSGQAIILKKPFDKTYLDSSSVMDYIRELGCMDSIRMTGTEADKWYISEAKEAMEKGDIIYAGKYSAPDYELILQEKCNLTIENTMIYHSPEVKEKLEELGIPVLVETSSYESHPLGRLEWIKLYGLLYDKEEEARKYYDEQLANIEPIMNREKTDLKVILFHVSSSGEINVRVPGDYITEMIELAGGNYIFPEGADSDIDGSTMKTSVNVQPEEFYKVAKDADIVIYNSTIGGELSSMDDFLEKNELFKNFKAVKSGAVYCTSANFFQKTTGIGEFMEDLNSIFTGEDGELKLIKVLE